MPDKPKADDTTPDCPSPVPTKFLNFFACWVSTLACAYLGAVTFLPVPESQQRIADKVVGFILGSMLTPIVTWAFRTSKAALDREGNK